MADATIQIYIRDLPRMRMFMWEIQQLIERMADAGNPEFEALLNIYSRLIADIQADEVDGEGSVAG